MKIKYSRAKRGDIKQMIKINEASMPETYDVKFWEDRIADHISMVAKSENTIVGYALISKYNTIWLLYSFAIDPSFRGNGIGKELLDRAIKEFKRSKNTVIYLTVRDSNHVAKHLYKSIGFTETCTVYYSDPIEDGIEMVI